MIKRIASIAVLIVGAAYVLPAPLAGSSSTNPLEAQTAVAQQPQPPSSPPVVKPVQQAPPSKPAPAPGVVQPATPKPPAAQQGPKTRGRDVNVQVELTITDQTGSAAAEKKVVSLIAADWTFGRVRSGSSLGVLNVDARPRILDGDRMLLELTIEYNPPQAEGTPPSRRPTPLNESLSVILQNGKPMLISQAADPVTDRKITVEARASIVK
jgi:hypothetical protein